MMSSDSQDEGREFEPRVPLRRKVSEAESLQVSPSAGGARQTAIRGPQKPAGIPQGDLNRPQIVHGYGVRWRT